MIPRNLFSDNWQGLTGPAIQLSYSYGGTSGRFTVADIIARVFPAYKAFVTDVSKDVVPPDSFSFGPYPKDTLTYKSKSVVEYITPAETDGLGTHTALKKNDHPIEGVAILVERTPDLLLLAVRLAPELAGLSSTIFMKSSVTQNTDLSRMTSGKERRSHATVDAIPTTRVYRCTGGL